MCETLMIMHNSRFVEVGSMDDIFNNPSHIYTKRLLASIPDTDPDKKEENIEKRNAISEVYSLHYNDYYQDGGRVYDLRQAPGSSTHFVAMP
jgi:peptide/nickel transport system ATP-binding protein